MDDQTQTNFKELKHLLSDKSLKSQKSWEEVCKKLSLNPTNDFFLEGREDSPPQEWDWELFNK